jgi:hypothetical protein
MEVRLGSIGGSLKKVPDCSIEKKKWIFGSLRSFLDRWIIEEKKSKMT